MKKTIFFSTLFMSFSLLFLSFVNKDTKDEVAVKNVNPKTSISLPSLADSLFDSLHLDSLGLTHEAIDYAVKGFSKLDSSGKVNNPFLTIVDLSQSSRKKRFYIIDMRTHQLVWNT
ncbi:MAG TPA: murein L,D-transpeptidase catalytic domain family protein, partial [Flavisolibacter sp.]|nr:murein L,D-transpeptidase catalytic domain family protein [Flavisolibacter sp.]